MVFLITGGAGFLGINLARYLLTRGQVVRCLDIADFTYPEAEKVDVWRGDIRDPNVVRNAMEGVEVVVHCAAALPLYPPEEIFSTGVEGTRMILTAGDTANVRRFIHVSSTAVYGVPTHHPILEDSPVSGVGPYGRAKIEAEEVCNGFRDRGMCVSVLRPKSFVGPERLGIFELLFDFASAGRSFPVLGPGTNRYQLLDVEDLCEAIYLCATLAPERVSDVFNVGASEFGSIRDDFQAVLDHAGFGRRIVCIPERPAVRALKLLEMLRLSPVYQWVYETMARESYVGIDKIRDRLGFSPRYSNREALIRNYDWYVAHRDEIEPKSGITHRAPWKRGALELAKHLF